MSVPLFFPRWVLYASVMVCAVPALCVLNFRMPVRAPLCTAFVYIYMMLRRWLCEVSAISCPTCDDSSLGEILLCCFPPSQSARYDNSHLWSVIRMSFPFRLYAAVSGQFIRIPNEVTVPALFFLLGGDSCNILLVIWLRIHQ